MLVVGGLRPSEPGADLTLLAELAGDPLAASLHPRPLTREAVAALVRHRLGEDVEEPFAAACHTSTGGNPLLLNELLKALDAEHVRPDAANVAVVNELGPRAASRAVLLRLARLPDPAVAVARALAVLGEGAETTAVARLAGLAEASSPRRRRFSSGPRWCAPIFRWDSSIRSSRPRSTATSRRESGSFATSRQPPCSAISARLPSRSRRTCW